MGTLVNSGRSGSRTDVLITGAGSLARALAHAFSLISASLSICVTARHTENLQWLVRSSNARARANHSAVTFAGRSTTWLERDLRLLFLETRPRLVVHTASLQSPWTLGGGDPWARLVRSAGYGITLPKQLVLAARAGRALFQSVEDASFVNACYPDAVNAMLYASGIPVMCGIGNLSILAAVYCADGGLAEEDIQLIGHHAHVSAAIGGRRPAQIRGWRAGAPIDDDLRRWVTLAKLPADDRLNAITGAISIPLLLGILGLAPHRGHAPGPMGLQGGYPVRARAGLVELDIPPAISTAEANALNKEAALEDGISIDAGGTATLAPHATEVVQQLYPSSALLGCLTVPNCESVVEQLAGWNL